MPERIEEFDLLKRYKKMLDKILVKLTGLILFVAGIYLIVQLIIINDDYDLLAFASRVVVITIAIIFLMLGVAFLMAKVSKKQQ